MVAIVVAIIFFQPKPPTGPIGAPISQALYANLSGVSATTLNSVGNGGTPALTTEPGPALTLNGKPEFLYVGADYCPYCAAERWSIIVALSKFGTFNNPSTGTSTVTYMLSSSTDKFPNTATFSFHGSSYASQYVAFVGVEIQDRNGATLDILTSDQTNIMRQYDSSQGIPFIDIYNQFVYVSSQFSPDVLADLNWTQIGSQLDNPTSTIAKNIDGAANNLITAICKVDGQQPSSVCNENYAKQFLPIPPLGQALAPYPYFSPATLDKAVALSSRKFLQNPRLFFQP